MSRIPKRAGAIAILGILVAWPVARAGQSRTCRQAGKIVSFRLDVLPALESKCIACHFDSETPPGLNFSLQQAYRNLVGRTSIEVAGEDIIKPGDPLHSYLITKVTKKPPVGKRMPPYGAALSSRELHLLTEWIAQGAQDN
ncbi:MAG: hypothetical protein ACRD2B_07715 [Terriglobia bacterium]